ncbi:MAG: hypothetical protein AB7D57_03820 [Desulfovibrionaceae bacterium]
MPAAAKAPDQETPAGPPVRPGQELTALACLLRRGDGYLVLDAAQGVVLGGQLDPAVDASVMDMARRPGVAARLLGLGRREEGLVWVSAQDISARLRAGGWR